MIASECPYNSPHIYIIYQCITRRILAPSWGPFDISKRANITPPSSPRIYSSDPHPLYLSSIRQMSFNVQLYHKKMPHYTHLFAEMHTNVIRWQEEGRSLREISRLASLPACTILRSLRSQSNKRWKGIRKPKTTIAQDRRIIITAKKNRCMTASQLVKDCNLNLHHMYVRKRLKKYGIICKKQLCKPLLSIAHKRASLLFFRKYRHWTENQWRKFLFSDETRMELFDRRRHQVMVVNDESMLTQSLLKLTSNRKDSVNPWGCFSFRRFVTLEFTEGTLNADAYISILDRRVASKMQNQQVRETWTYPHDNAPAHVVKSGKHHNGTIWAHYQLF